MKVKAQRNIRSGKPQGIPTPTVGASELPVEGRRKLAKAYKLLAEDPRFTTEERTEFSVMARTWARTLPKIS